MFMIPGHIIVLTFDFRQSPTTLHNPKASHGFCGFLPLQCKHDLETMDIIYRGRCRMGEGNRTMSTLSVMEKELEVLLKKAMANLQEDGFLVPIAFAFTSTSDMITMPGDKSSGVDDTKQWADLIRGTLAEFDAQFYIIIAESYVQRKKTQVDVPTAKSKGEAIIVQAFHQTGESIAKMVPFSRDNTKITFSESEALNILGGPLGENLFD